jgi:hypothetical protein
MTMCFFFFKPQYGGKGCGSTASTLEATLILCTWTELQGPPLAALSFSRRSKARRFRGFASMRPQIQPGLHMQCRYMTTTGSSRGSPPTFGSLATIIPSEAIIISASQSLSMPSTAHSSRQFHHIQYCSHSVLRHYPFSLKRTSTFITKNQLLNLWEWDSANYTPTMISDVSTDILSDSTTTQLWLPNTIYHKLSTTFTLLGFNYWLTFSQVIA